MSTLILDIGKTNVKCLVLDDSGSTVWSRFMDNVTVQGEPYPHFDVDGIWDFFLNSMREAAVSLPITAINISTHGACAVLLGDDDEPVLPVLDYEYADIESCDSDYAGQRLPFEQTFSPHLPAGLNLGRQLYWLKQQFPTAFSRIDKILMFPQYWVWRLTSIAVSEATSLGCHTDLWLPEQGDYSALVDRLAIRGVLPPLVDTYSAVGTVTASVAEEAGLSPDCLVYAGVHDSNASFARYLSSGLSAPFTLVSSGTWVITMAAGAPLSGLTEAQDTLANVDVTGQPLACARFMGGREFSELCRLTGAEVDDQITVDDIAAQVADQVFALPSFARGSGPFGGSQGRLTGETGCGKALATLYLALMLDYELDLLQAQGSVVFGNFSTKNPLMCSLLAQLRPQQQILLSSHEGASTALGAWCLTRWAQPSPARLSRFDTAIPTEVNGLDAYRDQWRQQAALAGDLSAYKRLDATGSDKVVGSK